MREEFRQALVVGTSLTATANRLRALAEHDYKLRLKSIERDLAGAELIKQGLTEPPDSEAYKLASSLLRDYEKTVIPRKPKPTKEVKEILRRLEEDWALEMSEANLQIDDDDAEEGSATTNGNEPEEPEAEPEPEPEAEAEAGTV